MYSAKQVAKFILGVGNAQGVGISNLRLQYLLYIAQTGFLAEEERRLFEEDIVAYSMGPQVREVYFEYCAYGGMDINTSGFFPGQSDIAVNDQGAIYKYIIPFLSMPMSKLCDAVRSQGGAWSAIFRQGTPGKVIPEYVLQSVRHCPRCNSIEHLPKAKYCMQCGERLPEPEPKAHLFLDGYGECPDEADYLI